MNEKKPPRSTEREHLERRILETSEDLFKAYQEGKISRSTLYGRLYGASMGACVKEIDCPFCGETKPVLGVDWGAKDVQVVSMHVGPNKNGDVFTLSDPKLLGEFPRKGDTFVAEGTSTWRRFFEDPPPKPSPKETNRPSKTAQRIQELTEQYIKTMQNDPHHVPQVPDKFGIPLIQAVLPALLKADEIRRCQEMTGKSYYLSQPAYLHDTIELPPQGGETMYNVLQYLRRRQQELADRLDEIYKKGDSVTDEMLWEIKQEMYQLYREQQRVEALVALRKEAEVNTVKKQVMHSVHLEHGEQFFELRARGRNLQTICFTRLELATPGSCASGDVVEGLLEPFCNEVMRKTTEAWPCEILNKVVLFLIANDHPRAKFIVDCCVTHCVRRMEEENVPVESIKRWSQSIAEKRDVPRSPLSKLSKEELRAAAKSTSYPTFGRDRSKEFQSALKKVHIKGEVYSSATQEAIKKREEEKPKKLVEQQVSRVEAEIEAEKLQEKTNLFQPNYCHKCGTAEGCMCPRMPVETHKDPCQHPFLVLISFTIAKELGVMVDKLEAGTQLYACRECQAVFSPFDCKQPTHLVPAK